MEWKEQINTTFWVNSHSEYSVDVKDRREKTVAGRTVYTLHASSLDVPPRNLFLSPNSEWRLRLFFRVFDGNHQWMQSTLRPRSWRKRILQPSTALYWVLEHHCLKYFCVTFSEKHLFDYNNRLFYHHILNFERKRVLRNNEITINSGRVFVAGVEYNQCFSLFPANIRKVTFNNVDNNNNNTTIVFGSIYGARCCCPCCNQVKDGCQKG